MNIGQAVNLLKSGQPIARDKWENDKFIYLVPANEYPAITEVAKSIAKENGKVPYLEYIAMATKEGITIYNPTCDDILANDWRTLQFA